MVRRPVEIVKVWGIVTVDREAYHSFTGIEDSYRKTQSKKLSDEEFKSLVERLLV